MAGDAATSNILGQSDQSVIGVSNPVTNSLQSVAISMPCYFGFSLKIGDNDVAKRWGGQIASSEGPYVSDLQRDLQMFGAFDGPLDGDFASKTEIALRRFQWVAKAILKRVVDGEQVRVESTFNGNVTGVMDDATCTEMKLWKDNKYLATGSLVKAPIDRYSEFQRGTLSSVRVGIAPSEMVFDDGFAAGLDALNAGATSNGIKIRVNQVIRVQGAAVSGAVVAPATRSQHLIGRAIDTNLVDGQTTMTTAIFRLGNETLKAKDFIAAVKLAGLRWGGDFGAVNSSSYDPPHFDLQISSASEEYDFKLFFNQKQLRLNQPILALE